MIWGCAWWLFRVNACGDRNFFCGEARAPRACAKRISRIGGDGKVHRECYLRFYKFCTKFFLIAASTGWKVHRRRTAVSFPAKNRF